MNKAIISILGLDRAGIIATVSKVLFNQDCNIENVSQTTLQFIFAGVFIVSMPEELSPESLKQSLKAEIGPLGFDVHITRLESPGVPVSPPHSEAYVITTKGPDQKGLVAGISEIIAQYDGNITNLQAVFKGGRDPGDNIMIYEVDIPPRTDQQALYRDLKKRATELNLDIDIHHRNIFEAMHRI